MTLERTTQPAALPGPRIIGCGCLLLSLSVMLWITCGSVAGQPVAGGEGAAAAGERAALTAEQQRELDHLLEDLRDTRLDAARRRRAAAILLDRPWPAAVAALRRQMLYGEDVAAARAIAQALAVAVGAPLELIGPLVQMLDSEDEGQRDDAAAALAQYDSPTLLEQLIDAAGDAAGSRNLRLGAIRALGGQRQHASVEALLKLGEDGDAAIRSAAFAALAQLSGLTAPGQDAQAWRRWWEQVRDMEREPFLAMLVRNLSVRTAATGRTVGTLTERLVSTSNRLYDAAADENRPAMLQQMLEDPMEELRQLSLRLIERRVLNAQPVGPDVRATMRQRMSDGSAAVRAQSARMLEHLADADGAELAIELLLGESEESVQAAYLGLLARVPRAQAVEPALMLLDRPGLRAGAAGVLVASFDAGLLEASQAQRALKAARFHVVDNDHPEPVMIRLLGRVGEAGDQPLVVRYLKHREAAVQLAAGGAFARSGSTWPLEPLLGHLGEATLWPLAVQAAGRRGSEAGTIEALLGHEPKDPEQQAAWREAILAVAGRLEMVELMKVHRLLSDQVERRGLHEDVLRWAAGMGTGGSGGDGNGESEPRRTEAAFVLGEFYVLTQQAGKARSVYERLETRPTMATEQRSRLAVARVRLMLEQGQVEEAIDLTRGLLAESNGLPGDVLAEPWLDGCERALEGKQVERARLLAGQVQELFRDRLGGKLGGRLAAVLKRLPTEEPAAPKAAPAKAPVKPAESGAKTGAAERSAAR